AISGAAHAASPNQGSTFHKEEHNHANEKEGHKEESSEKEITAARQTDLRPSQCRRPFSLFGETQFHHGARSTRKKPPCMLKIRDARLNQMRRNRNRDSSPQGRTSNPTKLSSVYSVPPR